MQADGAGKADANLQVESEVVRLWKEATEGQFRATRRRTTRWPGANDVVTSEATVSQACERAVGRLECRATTAVRIDWFPFWCASAGGHADA